MARTEAVTPPDYHVELIAHETAAWTHVLGVDIIVPPPPRFLTPEVLNNLDRAGMSVTYMPEIQYPKIKESTQRVSDHIRHMVDTYPAYLGDPIENSSLHFVGQLMALNRQNRTFLAGNYGWMAIDNYQPLTQEQALNPIEDRQTLLTADLHYGLPIYRFLNPDTVGLSPLDSDERTAACTRRARRVVSENHLSQSQRFVPDAFSWYLLARRGIIPPSETPEWTGTRIYTYEDGASRPIVDYKYLTARWEHDEDCVFRPVLGQEYSIKQNESVGLRAAILF